MSLKSIIKRAELFRGLNDEQLKKIEAISQEETYGQGATIIHQGAEGDALYILGKGQVEVQVRNSQGQSDPIIYLGEGQVFGEMALIDQGTRSASVIAVGDDTSIYRISTDDFTNLCQSNTDIGYVMMRNIAQDLSFKLRHRDFDPSSS